MVRLAIHVHGCIGVDFSAGLALGISSGIEVHLHDNPPFIATFHVERLPYQVWQLLAVPDVAGAHFRIPGFASDAPHATGCQAAMVRRESTHNVACRKTDAPGKDSEIHLTVGPANASGWPTRVTLSITAANATPPDLLALHAEYWRQSAANLHLFLERGVAVSTKQDPVALGAHFRQTEHGLEVTTVCEVGNAARGEMLPGDLLLTVAGARILDFPQLIAAWSTLGTRDQIAVSWLRANQTHCRLITLPG